MKYRSQPDLECKTNILEHCVVEIKLGNENILCSSCYRAPNTDVDLFLAEYALLLNNLKESKSKLVMGMDHNLDLLKYSKHRPTRDFVLLNENISLIPSITRPTRITSSSATLIDNIFVNSDFVRSLKSQILINDISDHLPICTVIENVNIGVKEKRKIVTRKITKGKLKLIQNELQCINWSNYLETHCNNPNDVNCITNVIHGKICDNIDKHAPLKEITVNTGKLKSEPWMTPGLKRSSQKLKKLYKLYLKQGSAPNARETYVLYRNCLNKVKRYCKAQHYKCSCENYKNNTKKLWEIINQCVGKTNNKNCIIDSIRTQNAILTDPTDIANELCNHYLRVGAKLSSTIPSPSTDKMAYVEKITRHRKSLFMTPTCREEIVHIIENLPNKASSGYDNLNNLILKSLKHEIAMPLEKIFNLSLETGIFPTLMKHAKVVPLYKGKEKDLSVNYRPISLLVTISKILEKIVYMRTYDFLDTSGQLYSSQYGFRSKHSSENAISELIGQIVKGHE